MTENGYTTLSVDSTVTAGCVLHGPDCRPMDDDEPCFPAADA